MPAGGEWPPALREFASRVFAACTDANRQAASDELKALIFRAFREGTLYTTDWHRMSLAALRPHKRGADSWADIAGGRKHRRAAAPPGPPPGPPPAPPPVDSRRAARAQRFEREHAAFAAEHARDAHVAAPAAPDPNVIDWDADTVVGTSTRLEKPYLRLTSAPDPATVRPLPTLRRTLALLMDKWRAERNYAYICDQFKSMRQDLTVQRIANDFTVQVYEIHARIALERGDLGEYNQCQSQLRVLYGYGIPGAIAEFTAYRILYLLHTRNWREVSALMAELTPALRADPAVAHALGVRAAMSAGNYHRFFALYERAPNMGAYIMDHFAERERVNALLIVARSFRPTCPLAFLTAELRIESENAARELLTSLGAGSIAGGQWDTRASAEPLAAAAARFQRVDIKGQL